MVGAVFSSRRWCNSAGVNIQVVLGFVFLLTSAASGAHASKSSTAQTAREFLKDVRRLLALMLGVLACHSQLHGCAAESRRAEDASAVAYLPILLLGL